MTDFVSSATRTRGTGTPRRPDNKAQTFTSFCIFQCRLSG
jgi:hypothetical protein